MQPTPPGTQSVDGPVEHGLQALRGRPAVDHHRREQLAAESGLHAGRTEHLLGRYGSLVSELFCLVRERPDLGEPLIGVPSYLRVEAHYAAWAEGALHLDDILTRRTRISIDTADRGLGAAEAVAELVAPVLAGASRILPTRSSTTVPGSRLSATPSSSPTTEPRTPRA